MSGSFPKDFLFLLFPFDSFNYVNFPGLFICVGGKTSEELSLGVPTPHHVIPSKPCEDYALCYCSLQENRAHATDMIRGLEASGKLRELGLFSLEKIRFWGDLQASFQYLKNLEKSFLQGHVGIEQGLMVLNREKGDLA